VDVVCETPRGPRDGLEVAVQSAAHDGRDGAREALGAWIRETLLEGLIDLAAPCDSLLVLDPALFPANRLPAAYPAALAIGSRRAVSIIGALSDSAVGASLSIAREELALTYRALVPRARRRAALLWHATWLEAMAGVGATAAPAAGMSAEGADPTPVALPPLEDYAAPRRNLARYRARLARLGPAVEADDALASIVARLAHIQTIRLCGPPGADARSLLQHEAAVLRDLSSGLR
jgi:hypothetical protein